MGNNFQVVAVSPLQGRFQLQVIHIKQVLVRHMCMLAIQLRCLPSQMNFYFNCSQLYLNANELLKEEVQVGSTGHSQHIKETPSSKKTSTA